MLQPHPVLLPLPDLSRWREGNTGVEYVHRVDSGRPGPQVLLTALVHGNEYSGAVALAELLALGLRPRKGALMVAFCNVAAFAGFDPLRPDASRFVDEDFNRVWSPARLDAGGDSVELRRARELRPFVERCTHLLDLHSMHEPCMPLMVTGTLPHNVAFARRLGCPGQIVMDEGHADGLRMRDYPVGAASRVALLLEAGQHWAPASADAARNAVMRFLVEAGSIAPADALPGWLLEQTAAVPAVQVTHRVVARSMDFRFLGTFSGGEVIPEAATPIAEDGGELVRTPYRDCVLVMPSVRQLRPGVTTVRLGRLA